MHGITGEGARRKQLHIFLRTYLLKQQQPDIEAFLFSCQFVKKTNPPERTQEPTPPWWDPSMELAQNSESPNTSQPPPAAAINPAPETNGHSAQGAASPHDEQRPHSGSGSRSRLGSTLKHSKEGREGHSEGGDVMSPSVANTQSSTLPDPPRVDVERGDETNPTAGSGVANGNSAASSHANGHGNGRTKEEIPKDKNNVKQLGYFVPPPGRPTLTRKPPPRAVLLPENRYCSRDEIVKPYRAHHCRACGTVSGGFAYSFWESCRC